MMKWLRLLWNKFNGRKTATGIVMLVGGYAMMQCPSVPVEQFGVYLFNMGMAAAGFGALHKVKKGA